MVELWNRIRGRRQEVADNRTAVEKCREIINKEDFTERDFVQFAWTLAGELGGTKTALQIHSDSFKNEAGFVFSFDISQGKSRSQTHVNISKGEHVEGLLIRTWGDQAKDKRDGVHRRYVVMDRIREGEAPLLSSAGLDRDIQVSGSGYKSTDTPIDISDIQNVGRKVLNGYEWHVAQNTNGNLPLDRV